LALPDKKVVCSTLTGVVKTSPLAGAIEPSAFFMQLMSNYAVLCRDGVLDLVFLYEPLVNQYPAGPLAELFEQLGQAGRGLGFDVRMPMLPRDTDPPEGLQVLPPAQRTPSTPAPPPTPAPIVPINALTPVQQGLVANLVGALKGTEVGSLLSAPQLTYFISSRLNDLFDGQTFHFSPVYDAVLEIRGVEEKHVYIAAQRFKRWISRGGVNFIEPEWKLDPAARQKLDETAAKLPVEAAHGPTGRHISANSMAPEPPKDSGPEPGETRQEARLRRYGLTSGLLGQGKWPLIRIGLGVVLIIVTVALREVLAPMVSVENATYAAVFPSKEVFLFEGKWMGVIDEDRWLKMPLERREKALRDLTQVLKSEGRLAGARILHPRDRTLVGFDAKSKGGMMIAESYLKAGLPEEKK